MAIVKQKGILDVNSNPETDSNIIMTAALIGHAYERLTAGKNCRIDFEVKDPYHPTAEIVDIENHHAAIKKINSALLNGGLSPGKVMQLGITPIYDVEGNVTTITGGTGDKDITDADRYNPGVWSNALSNELYKLALGKAVDSSGKPINVKLGYQGVGAYTGFVDGRKTGQSNLMSTYRFKVPDFGRRWIPTSELSFSKWFGSSDNQHEAWGTLGDNAAERALSTVKEGSMYFQDKDKSRNTEVKLTDNDVVGYVHGMIQAVYDVEFHKLASGGKLAGVPYEIAVGAKTSKLASCFACALFMEANGYPASATHIGRSDSWCIVHSTNHPDSKSENESRANCNDKWAGYCKKIINRGLQCLVTQNKNLVKQDHQFSYAALKAYLKNKENIYDYGNLILDALTMHKKVCDKVNACIQ